MESVIVVGGGASGLMVAAELSKHNKKIMLLEASGRLGGRIHTDIRGGFSMPVELGAEFIHGNLPVTLNLLKEAGIKFYKTEGNMFRLENGKLKKQNEIGEQWNDVMKEMAKLEKDIPFSDFLNEFFSDTKYESLRNSATGFAEGFDLADTTTASTRSLYNEWSKEEGDQYRIEGGYKQLINYLEAECKKNGVEIYLDCCVKKINWRTNKVNVLTMCSRIFNADKIVIAVPVSILQSGKTDTGYIEFEPVINKQISAAKNIGFGSVIKVIFEFDEPFWNEENKNVGFLFSSGFIPTWWTQLPKENPVLTGWLGGPKAHKLKKESNEFILQKAIESLALAFNKPSSFIKQKLVAHKIVNWGNEKNISGGYSFNTIKSKEAKSILQQPVNETIFFAGEAIYDGKDEGTVEAALTSAKNAVERVLKTSN